MLTFPCFFSLTGRARRAARGARGVRGERRPPARRAAMGNPGEKKYIKKKIRPGAIVLDPRDTAIVVQYELEGQLLAPDGVTVITELFDGTKRIKVKALDQRTDICALADEIVTACELIHHSKTGEVRSVLAELRDRVVPTRLGAKTDAGALETARDDDGAARRGRRDDDSRTLGSLTPFSTRARASRRETSEPTTQRRRDASRADDPTAEALARIVAREEKRLLAEAEADVLSAPPDVAAETRRVSGIGSIGLTSRLTRRFGALDSSDARDGGRGARATTSVELLDEVLERLYDDDAATRAECVAAVAAVAADARNLRLLASHETLPQTLARVLREDGRRSADIAANISATFFALSNASAFHGLILGNRVGDATLRLIDLELRRAADRRTMRARLASPRPRDPRDPRDRDDVDDVDDVDAFEARRAATAERKRDALLYVAFRTLLNLAEDVAVERKMAKRDVVACLMECVGTRDDVDLLVLCVTFLCKLSVRRENVEDMLRGANVRAKTPAGRAGATSDDVVDGDAAAPPGDVVSRVARFLADGDTRVPDVLVSATLRLLRNLSFHERARDAMHERALLPRLCVFARREAREDAKTREDAALAVLYHLSVDEDRRRFFAVARPVSGTALALDALASVSEREFVARRHPILTGLAVNLSADARCAEALAGRDGGKPFLAFLAARARRKDALGLKIARNVARHAGNVADCPSVARAMRAAAGDRALLRSMLDCFVAEDPPGTDVAIEALGLLADAHRPATREGPDLSGACAAAGVFERVAAYLAPNETEDDAALEAVLFCFAFAVGSENERNARAFVETGIVTRMYELLREKKDDDAFALAVVSAFGAFLGFPETRDVVLNDTQTVFYLVELLRDECAAIRDAADAALDVVVDEGGEPWAVEVRRARFEAHNREWLEACGGGGDGAGRGYASEPGEETGGRPFDGFGGSRECLVYDDPARYYGEAEAGDMYGF